MKIAIIGGGACGMMAAIAATEQKASVTVFENVTSVILIFIWECITVRINQNWKTSFKNFPVRI